MIDVIFLFLLLISFPDLRLYIILGHSEILLAIPSPSGVNTTNISLLLKILTFLLFYKFSFSIVTINNTVHFYDFLKRHIIDFVVFL